MDTALLEWQGRDLVLISAEGRSHLDAPEAMRDVIQRCDTELGQFGLSLKDTVRTRLWAATREARDQGSVERVRSLSGGARSASSSYITPSHFESDASVGLELVAMRPTRANAMKQIQEYEPAIVPVRFITYDGVVFLSGVTSVAPTLSAQLAEIHGSISASLTLAGVSWGEVTQVSCHLHRSRDLTAFRSELHSLVQVDTCSFDFAIVDGYSTEGKLIEVEVTALKGM